jgi:hypothetical protein
VACREDEPRKNLFLLESFLGWIARNPLKSPESDEEIQDNPRKSKPVFLGFSWTRLEEFGPARHGVGRLLLARFETPNVW